MEKKLEKLHDIVAAQHGNICEIEVMKNGETVYHDERNGFARTDAANVMSVTKSVVSLLIGIAIDKGMIRNVQQPVLDFFPAYTVKRGEKTIQQVTLAHLLTMTAPFKYRYEPWTKVCTSPDWTAAALDLLGGRGGITGEYKYATLGIQILMGVIAQVSGMTTLEFANRFLFAPLGLAPRCNITAETAQEQQDFTLSAAPRQCVWFVDPAGVNTAGWGLCLSAREMAVIGEMCRCGGQYNGTQIVSPEWIAQSTQPRYDCGPRFGNMSYGYLWWIPDRKQKAFAASGVGGNVIYVNPESGMVVAVAATFNPRVFDRITFIKEQMEPYFT